MRPRLVFAPLVLSAALAASGCVGGMGGPMYRAGMGGGGHGMMSMGAMVGCPGRHGDADAQLSRLHASLNVTAAQEAAWSAYADAFRRHASHMGMDAMQHQMGPSAVPARVRSHVEKMEAHLASMRAFRDALEGLYAVLTPEQRTTADALVCEPGAHSGR